MEKYNNFSGFLFENSTLPRETKTTQKTIASEVAVEKNTYYGFIRPIDDEYDKKKKQGDFLMKNVSDEAEGNISKLKDWTSTQCRDQLEYGESPLPLQLFISSLSDALSYTSVDTTVTDFRYNSGGPHGSTVLNVTPMGSTTKLITSETGSTSLKVQLCGTKCFPIFGTLFMTILLTSSLGNIFRLPTTVFFHGGGTFLVVYIILAIILGIPLIFLEITLGQFCQQGTTKLWRAVPLFKGVGVVKLLSCTILCLYYPVLIVQTLFYTAWSLYQPLPTSQCYTKLLPKYIDVNITTNALRELCSAQNNTGYDNYLRNDFTWFGIEVAALMIVWLILLLCLLKNADSLRLSSFILIPSALFIITTLLADGIQRNTKGIEYLLKFRWESLLSFDIWYSAMIQLFFSTHIGFGNITTCAGRLYPKNNPFWTAVFCMLINVFVGISFVSIVYMWIVDLTSTGKVLRIPEVQELFVLTLIYDVMSQFYGKFAQLWAFVSFLLIILSGICSLVSLFYTVIVGITVETKNKYKWWHISAIVCCIFFVVTSFCLLQENVNIIRLFDHYVVSKLVITSTVLEITAFVWFYGLEALANDFEFVLGYKLNILWKILWFFIPFILTVTEVLSWFYSSPAESLYVKSDFIWLNAISWIIYLFIWLVIITMALWQIFSQVDYNLSQKYVSSIKPTRNWGPVDPIYRHCWVQWKKQYQVTGEKDFTLRRRGTRDYTHSVRRGRHAGPIGMRYSIHPSSNQNTLSYKMDKENNEHYNGNINAWCNDNIPCTNNNINDNSKH